MMILNMSCDQMSDSVKDDPRINHIPIIVLIARAVELTKLTTLSMEDDNYIVSQVLSLEKTKDESL